MRGKRPCSVLHRAPIEQSNNSNSNYDLSSRYLVLKATDMVLTCHFNLSPDFATATATAPQPPL
jgi:hypothetical protein